MRRMFFFFYFFCGVLFSEEFVFEGTHFVASYIECDEKAIGDVLSLQKAFSEAVESSGATILGTSTHVFPENGLTMVILLSESHASVHTYPEHRSCFVDLFTCGTSCSFEEFDRLLTQYLKPNEAEKKVLFRGKKVYDFSK